MIRIAVAARAGAAPAALLAAQFGPEGGTIGRAESNTLVLDDPERTVSRLHAQVLYRDGCFVLLDRGSNPMQHNGRALGSGQEAVLSHGDRLLVGSFELVVEDLDRAGVAPTAPMPQGASLVDDPFADLLKGLVPPPAPVAVPVKAGPEQIPFPDPLGLDRPADAVPDAHDPLGHLLAPGTTTGQPADDFSDLVAPVTGKAPPIDALFDLGGGVGGDPLAMGPLGDPLVQPNTAGAVDPLRALQEAAKALPQARADHLPIGEFGFVPPRAMPSAAAPAERALAPPPPAPPASHPAPVATPPDPPGLETFDTLLEDLAGGPAAQPTPPVKPPMQRPDERVRVGFEFAPAAGRSGSAAGALHADAPAPAPSATMSTAPGDPDLLAALLRGLGALQQPPAALTPALMERMGRLLRIATEGTLQLLLTRQEFKREVRAQVTVIASQANNPLKFSPTVEVALAHLLGPGMQGFMQAEAAMRDAYRDLRAHEFGLMVGMRAALAHVIDRFSPDALEQNIAARTKLDSLFAAGRKARLWEQFLALYGSIAKEAEDDFHSLFGKAFLQAYDEQMARLAAAERDTDRE